MRNRRRDSLFSLLMLLSLFPPALGCRSESTDQSTRYREHPLVEEGRRQFARAEYDSAIETLTQALQDSAALADDDLDQAHRYLARAYLFLGRHDRAQFHVQRALAARPEDPELHEILGAIYAARATGRAEHSCADSAIAAFRTALKLDENRPRAYYNLGMIYAYLDSSGQAEQSLLAAVAADSSLAAAHKKLGILYRKQGAMDKALHYLERALHYSPDDAETHFHISLALRALGREQEAVRHLERAAELNPYSPQIYYNLGTLYMRLDRREEGRRVLQRSEILRLNDRGDRSEIIAPAPGALAIGTGRFHCQLALNHALRGDYKEAIVGFRNAVELEPDLQIAHSSLGLLLAMQGDLEEAASHLERAIALDSTDAVSCIRLGLVRVKQDDFDGARNALEQASRIDSSMPELAFTWGLFAARSGRLQEALAHFSRAIELRPSYLDAHLNLGVVYMKLGRFAAAAQAYSQVVELDPGNAQAYLYLSDAYRKLGDEAKSRLYHRWARQLREREKE